MKICFVEPHLEIYGGIRRILELSNRLIDLGEQVTIYHPDGSPCSWFPCKAHIKPLRDILKRDCDVVIFNDPPHYKIVRRVNAPLKVHYLLGLYEKDRLKGYSIKMLWPKRGRMLALKRALQMPYLKITNATWMQAYLEQELGIESELVIGGINQEMFFPAPVDNNPAEVRLLCTGDPREFKGTQTVFEAVEIAKGRIGNLILDTYFGKGIPQDRMAETISRADMFIDAQWDTGCGWNNPVAEAMACRIPVICTDIGGVRDFAYHGKTAWLIQPDDPVRLADAIIRLMEDSELRRRLADAGYRRILRFDWDDSAKNLRAILRRHLIEAKSGLRGWVAD